MKLKAIFFGLFLLAFGVAAQAQTATPGATSRQAAQQKRIKQGVNSGELTRGEAVQLEKQQRRVNRSKKQAKADGQVTAAERAQIHRQQNRASKNIARKKHNVRDRN